jgi:hypothetical protein
LNERLIKSVVAGPEGSTGQSQIAEYDLKLFIQLPNVEIK